jgi:hypothetical protein
MRNRHSFQLPPSIFYSFIFRYQGSRYGAIPCCRAEGDEISHRFDSIVKVITFLRLPAPSSINKPNCMSGPCIICAGSDPLDDSTISLSSRSTISIVVSFCTPGEQGHCFFRGFLPVYRLGASGSLLKNLPFDHSR